MELLGNKTPQVEFNSIHVLILAVISANDAKLVKVIGYSAISANN